MEAWLMSSGTSTLCLRIFWHFSEQAAAKVDGSCACPYFRNGPKDTNYPSSIRSKYFVSTRPWSWCRSWRHDVHMILTWCTHRAHCIRVAFASRRFLLTRFSWQVSSHGSGLQGGGLFHTTSYNSERVLKYWRAFFQLHLFDLSVVFRKCIEDECPSVACQTKTTAHRLNQHRCIHAGLVDNSAVRITLIEGGRPLRFAGLQLFPVQVCVHQYANRFVVKSTKLTCWLAAVLQSDLTRCPTWHKFKNSLGQTPCELALHLQGQNDHMAKIYSSTRVCHG